MRADNGIDQTSLAWIKPEIDACLARAAEALERYADNGFQGDSAQAALAELHEVQGVLRILELYGAALVAEEMERLLSEVIAERVARVEDALSSLLRASLQLPDYLERLRAGYRDVPIVLLPLLNDLRSCRGEKLLSESALLIPAIDSDLPADLPRPVERLAGADLERQLGTIRRSWEFALLEWFRGKNSESALVRMRELCDGILAVVSVRPARTLWWASSAVVEALHEHLLDTSISIKLLFGRLDREIKRLIDQGENLYAEEPPDDLLRSVLYYVAQASQSGPRSSQVREAFALDGLLPSDEEIDQARGVLSGRNSQLLGSVSQALEEELLRVKDALDLYLRGSRSDASGLQSELPVLVRVADTLGILGMGLERGRVLEQRRVLTEIIEGGEAVADQVLLDVASALLEVETSLQEHRSGFGVPVEESGGKETGRLSGAERQHLIEAALKEVAFNLQQSKELFVAQMAAPEGGNQHRDAVVTLRDVAGALRLLEFEGAAERTLALAGFLRSVAASGRALGNDEIDAYADALSGVEYYLELVADHQGHDDGRLQRITDALMRLGHWPPAVSLRDLFTGTDDSGRGETPVAGTAHSESAAVEPARDDVPTVEPVADDVDDGHDDDGSGIETVTLSDDALEPARSQVMALIESSGYAFQDGSGADDDDIRSTFLDELSDEILQLDEQLPYWRKTPDDLERLRSIRRSYHTIKGSGRMVGAVLLGEFAWQVENLLNRVLNGHRPVSSGVMRLVENATAALPEFHAALCGDVTPRRDVASIMAAAQMLAEGQEFVLPRLALVEGARPVAASADGGAEEASGPAVDIDDTQAHTGGHSLDPVLLDILRSEVAGHLGVIESYLHDARENSALAIVPEHLLRAVHTLNGAFGAVDLAQVTVLTAPLEAYVRRLRGLHMAPITAGRDAIASASQWLGRTMDRLERDEPPEEPGDLPEQLRTLVAVLPEARDDTAWLMDELAVSPEDASTSLPEGIEDVPELEPVTGTDAGAVEGAIDAAAADVVDDTSSVAGIDLRSTTDEVPPTPAVAEVGDSIAEADRLIVEAAPETPPDAGSVTDRETDADADRRDESDGEFGGAWAGGKGTGSASSDSRHEDKEAAATIDSIPASDNVPGTFDTEFLAAVDPQAGHDLAPAAGDDEPNAPDPSTAAGTGSQDGSVADAGAAPEPSADDTPEGSDEVMDRVALLRLLDSLPSTPPTDIDPDLAELFREEARELLDQCEQHLANRKDGADDVLAQELARELHTLKGGARMAGFFDAGEVGHAMESLLETAALDKRSFDSADLSLIGRCLDSLNHLIFPSAEPVAPVVPAPSPAPPVPETPEPEVPVAETIAEAEPPPATGAAADDAPTDNRPEAYTGPTTFIQEPVPESSVGEFVRVRADQLDSLVNLAGEVGIIRTRMEQQIGAFRFNLEELEQTVQRLREQLRKLEIEAETQILSREVRVQERSGDAHFDPLELDRFSQLQQLSRALAESMSDLQSIQGLLEEHTRLAESLLLQQSRAGAELQEGLMRARMVPFESMLPRLRRLVRQEGEALRKRVRLSIEGGHGELDRGVLERMAAPFEHMLRNALVHGLETPEERARAGKDEEGEIRIRVARQATEVIIEIADDGRGIDPQRIRASAIERGLLAPESDLSDRDLFGFIMEPGFTTAAELTQYAGRGVGLDVVASEIKQLGGSVSIESTLGEGAVFAIRLPYTLAVSQAVLVRVGEHTFAVPMAGVQGIVRLAHGNYLERMADPRPKVEYAGEDYELYELDGMLNLVGAALDENAQVPLLMIRAGDLRAALRVDSLLGGREIVVKPVGPQLARIPGVFGATILGDGAVVVILDVAVLLRRAAALRERGEAPTQTTIAPVVRLRPLVFVVDDSITMRKVSARVLEREGYEVQAAKDGLDALEQMHERVPDLILLDLEMPRMDGYELAGYMRADPRFNEVPIIVITSRVGEKHRRRAFDLGVDRYLGKPYQEVEMITAVAELLEERKSAKAAQSAGGE